MNETIETTETLEPVKTAVPRSAVSTAAHARNVPPVSPEPHASKLHLADDHDEDEGFFERHRVKLIAVAIVLIGGTVTYMAMTTEKTKVKKAPERKIVSVQLPPPPAPPPPPPPPKLQPPPPKEEKMIEQKPIEDTPKPPEKADEPPALGTGIKGDGKADGFGVGKSGNGGGFGGPRNGGGGGGRFDAYAAQARTTITNALRQNPKTRSATINRQILRYWQDSTGRVTRAKLDSSTGDAALDAAIIEALIGLQGPPPQAGMPMPVVIRFSAQRR